ncbi:MAG: helix-turn-helix transcriptional regulator [Legionella sp.]|uniref:helix-turn-helix domain-containing protein n=1 Tax=Legionella sp. TaxID=459 RepID=UPI0039E578C3
MKFINMQSTLNTELLASMLKSRRGKKGLRDTAAEIGSISSATLSRIEQGNLPDVETFIRICKWLDVSTETFVTGESLETKALSEKDKIVYQLRSSHELDPETINAMITMVDIAFTKSKNNAL